MNFKEYTTHYNNSNDKKLSWSERLDAVSKKRLPLGSVEIKFSDCEKVRPIGLTGEYSVTLLINNKECKYHTIKNDFMLYTEKGQPSVFKLNIFS